MHNISMGLNYFNRVFLHHFRVYQSKIRIALQRCWSGYFSCGVQVWKSVAESMLCLPPLKVQPSFIKDGTSKDSTLPFDSSAICLKQAGNKMLSVPKQTSSQEVRLRFFAWCYRRVSGKAGKSCMRILTQALLFGWYLLITTQQLQFLKANQQAHLGSRNPQ